MSAFLWRLLRCEIVETVPKRQKELCIQGLTEARAQLGVHEKSEARLAEQLSLEKARNTSMLEAHQLELSKLKMVGPGLTR